MDEVDAETIALIRFKRNDQLPDRAMRVALFAIVTAGIGATLGLRALATNRVRCARAHPELKDEYDIQQILREAAVEQLPLD